MGRLKQRVTIITAMKTTLFDTNMLPKKFQLTADMSNCAKERNITEGNEKVLTKTSMPFISF